MTALQRRDAEAWASSGAMELTGRPDGPGLMPPAGLLPFIAMLERSLMVAAAALGRELIVDALAHVGERSAHVGFRRQGDVSCGGSCRLLPTADGWVAVNLARPSDLELLPAWLGVTVPEGDDPWPVVGAAVCVRRSQDLAILAAELGMAVSALGEVAAAAPIAARSVHPELPPRGLDGLVVVDLSSLWAGPVCSRLMQRCGAHVIKVESTGRPDGARAGSASFFEALHPGQQEMAIDLSDPAGLHELGEVLAGADVVIEGSRPRALRQMGIVAEDLLASPGGPRVWMSITGYGRDEPSAMRVGFGDDCAVAGGLVAVDDRGPCFVADAVADPLSGLVGAAGVLAALAEPGSWLLDVALARVAAAATTWPAHDDRPSSPSGLVGRWN